MLQKMYEELEILYPQMVEWRRHFHQNPELSFQEVQTAKMISEILESYGIEVRTNVGGGGIVGTIRGGKPGKTIALRADFDALPIQDLKEVSYKSQVPGVMHACGHDAHTASLLAIAKVLSDNREVLSGNVVLLHQHAEELNPGGAISMIEDGCLDGVDVVFGNHFTSTSSTGTYLFREGYAMAAVDDFTITIQGKGGHGASPHETIDAIVVGASLVNQLQYIVSRKINPLKSAVVTIGAFHAGGASNVIADSAVIKGTIRSFDQAVRDQLESDFRNIVKGVCESFQATYELTYTYGYPATYNHPKETKVFKDIMNAAYETEKIIEIDPLMGSEDFSYYLKERPGMFFFTGAQNDAIGANYPHHHPKFDIDEKAMLYAGKAFLTIVNHYLVTKVTEPISSSRIGG